MNDSATLSREQRESLHLQLQDMLAGYVDQELDEQEQVQVEAHLAGCDACYQDVARQQQLQQQLGQIPGTILSPQQHARFDKTLAAASAPIGHAFTDRFDWKRWQLPRGLKGTNKTLIAATGGWSLALLLLVVMFFPSLKTTGHAHIPMVEDALAEYAQVAHRNLPISQNGARHNPPTLWPDAKILASWKTTIGGAPADAFALRSGQHILLQFRVGDDVFFNSPKVRAAIASKGNYQTREKTLKVLALPLQEGGILVVGPGDSMPSSQELKTTLL